MTVVIELLGMADDSFGCIGDSFQKGIATYLKIPPEKTGIDEEVFFSDLLDFLIWACQLRCRGSSLRGRIAILELNGMILVTASLPALLTSIRAVRQPGPRSKSRKRPPPNGAGFAIFPVPDALPNGSGGNPRRAWTSGRRLEDQSQETDRENAPVPWVRLTVQRRPPGISTRCASAIKRQEYTGSSSWNT